MKLVIGVASYQIAYTTIANALTFICESPNGHCFS